MLLFGLFSLLRHRNSKSTLLISDPLTSSRKHDALHRRRTGEPENRRTGSRRSQTDYFWTTRGSDAEDISAWNSTSDPPNATEPRNPTRRRAVNTDVLQARGPPADTGGPGTASDRNVKNHQTWNVLHKV
ncbi:hypothetical protein VZT92_024081 [Zoarces viviparus]|uniref:Uncharacterized protein n=1 Tax=Zoarces viviparus TaxID=48416 RepID=A0AAW1E0X0_ZOAVI